MDKACYRSDSPSARSPIAGLHKPTN